jgi:acetyltransferase-like isoleucine patch superfamily enzyme
MRWPGRRGRNLRVQGPCASDARWRESLKNLHVGDDVTLGGTTYLLMRAGGRVRIGQRCRSAPRSGSSGERGPPLDLGDDVQAWAATACHGGHGLSNGADSWLAGFVYMNTSDHKIERVGSSASREHGAAIAIRAATAWEATASSARGVRTGRGSVVGAGAWSQILRRRGHVEAIPRACCAAEENQARTNPQRGAPGSIAQA